MVVFDFAVCCACARLRFGLLRVSICGSNKIIISNNLFLKYLIFCAPFALYACALQRLHCLAAGRARATAKTINNTRTTHTSCIQRTFCRVYVCGLRLLAASTLRLLQSRKQLFSEASCLWKNIISIGINSNNHPCHLGMLSSVVCTHVKLSYLLYASLRCHLIYSSLHTYPMFSFYICDLRHLKHSNMRFCVYLDITFILFIKHAYIFIYIFDIWLYAFMLYTWLLVWSVRGEQGVLQTKTVHLKIPGCVGCVAVYKNMYTFCTAHKRTLHI